MRVPPFVPPDDGEMYVTTGAATHARVIIAVLVKKTGNETNDIYRQ